MTSSLWKKAWPVWSEIAEPTLGGDQLCRDKCSPGCAERHAQPSKDVRERRRNGDAKEDLALGRAERARRIDVNDRNFLHARSNAHDAG